MFSHKIFPQCIAWCIFVRIWQLGPIWGLSCGVMSPVGATEPSWESDQLLVRRRSHVCLPPQTALPKQWGSRPRSTVRGYWPIWGPRHCLGHLFFFFFLAFYRSIIHIQQNVRWWVRSSMNFHILNSFVYSTPWLTNSITSNPKSPQRLTLVTIRSAGNHYPKYSYWDKIDMRSN